MCQCALATLHKDDTAQLYLKKCILSTVVFKEVHLKKCILSTVVFKEVHLSLSMPWSPFLQMWVENTLI